MGVVAILEKAVLVGLISLFMMASLCKLFPSKFPEEVGADMNRKFQQYCHVCVTILFGYQPNPMTYKLVTGIIELAGALALILKDTRKVGCVLLIITMAGAVQTLICLKEYKESIFPSCVFLALCFLYHISGRTVSLEKSKTE
ncbi:Hypothetical predicted protein [Mytilus galloprovincialis]|uniref:Transmembrane protein 35A n=1 Tax=Mytilus galloprovincialis TaxID=29158 RepID=A0A8B6CSB3_MYTGA|nr:Hypothetical predicted protein [Mytilus galloprovincialis]